MRYAIYEPKQTKRDENGVIYSFLLGDRIIGFDDTESLVNYVESNKNVIIDRDAVLVTGSASESNFGNEWFAKIKKGEL